jgi:putative iron-regulated protein
MRNRQLVLLTGALGVGMLSVTTLAEGGEGGAIAALSSTARQYRLMSAPGHALDRIDAVALKQNYVRFAAARYQRAHEDAVQMKTAIEAFLSAPGKAQLAKARAAWRRARPSYLHTEIFRYYDGPIDAPAFAGSSAGPEPRINAWPLNEAVIDYVQGDPKSGIINDLTTPLTPELIKSRDQLNDEADVTTGWHAIEFLLWGQDQSAKGPGDRPHTDFLPGDPARDRRRAYLQAVTNLLIEDLQSMIIAWDARRPEGYAAKFLQLDAYEALGRMLTGASNYAFAELASERLSVGLDSGSQEDEHSCFSDTSISDLQAGVAGIELLFSDQGAGLLKLLTPIDRQSSAELRKAIARAKQSATQMPQPMDQLLLSAPGAKSRQKAERMVTDLNALARAIASFGRQAGTFISAPAR